MKKILALLLVLALSLTLVACGSGKKDAASTGSYKVAMVTDYGDITDQSFNQTTWEAVVAFGKDNNVETKYYKPTSNDTAGRVASVELAIAEGYNVIVMPGYAFGGTIVEVAPNYPDVKFVALDVAKGDLLETAVANKGESYDYNPDNWKLEDYVDMSNVYCAIYQEELAGYMAGYAAVKLGYTKLGFTGGGGGDNPACCRYGYGFVQGASAAAAEMGVKVEMNYSWLYGASFSASTELQTMASGWYENGTEAIFACGGNMFQSVAAAAAANDGAVVGVDVDQSSQSDTVITSAMKGLSEAVNTALADIDAGSWGDIAGSNGNFGLEDGDYIGLPTDADSWNFESFTTDEYEEVKGKIKSGEITVDNSSDDATKPTVSEFTTVNYIQ